MKSGREDEGIIEEVRQDHEEAIFKSQIEAVTMASQDPVVVEFSSPNTNKPQHLGHVRNNIYGQCVVNMHHALGQPCLAVNLVNDRGTHICKSMLAYEMSEDRPNPQKTGQKGDHLVGQFYIDFARKSEKEPELEKKAQEMLQKCNITIKYLLLEGVPYTTTYEQITV